MKLKPIPGFLNYFISPDGEVYSAKARGRWTDIPQYPLKRLKKILVGKPEYCHVVLYSNGNHKRFKVSVLVLSTFVCPRPAGMVACHGPNGRLDDSLSNLYWGTLSQNTMDRVRDGTDNRGEKHSMRKLNALQVRVIRRCREIGIKPRVLSKIFGIGRHQIRNIFVRESWRHL